MKLQSNIQIIRRRVVSKLKVVGKVFMALFALPIAAFGVIVGGMLLSTIMQSREAAKWDVIPCGIL